MKAKIKKMDDCLQEAYRLSSEIVEEMARNILRKHSNLKDFCMAMGGAFFTDNDDI